MSNRVLLDQWLSMYEDGNGIADSPTCGLMAELVFRELIDCGIRPRIVKGTFGVGINTSKKRKSKYQYDWLLYDGGPPKRNVNLSEVSFCFLEPKQVQCVIEVKSGDYIGKNALYEIAKFQKDRAQYKPWIYVTFGESKKTYDVYRKGEIDLSGYNGAYFCLNYYKSPNSIELIEKNMKLANAYLYSIAAGSPRSYKSILEDVK